jgi:hypothetical protein
MTEMQAESSQVLVVMNVKRAIVGRGRHNRCPPSCKATDPPTRMLHLSGNRGQTLRHNSQLHEWCGL